MGFVKKREELSLGQRNYVPATFYQAEVISILYETNPEVLKSILPPPLEPYENPYVIFNYNIFPRVNFGLPYDEPALMIPAKYNGVPGMYTLGMILNEDIGIYHGRIMGYPKKYGSATYKWEGDVFTGSVERHGITFAKIRVELMKKDNEEEVKKIFTNLFAPAGERFPGHESHGINWLHANPYATKGNCWDDMMKPNAENVKLVAGWKTAQAVEAAKYGEGSINFTWSEDDPWAELEVINIVGARRTVSDVQLLETEALGEVSAKDYAPHAYYGWDAYHMDYMGPYSREK